MVQKITWSNRRRLQSPLIVSPPRPPSRNTPFNNDIELNLPQVRARLRHHVGAGGPADYEFISHGEAFRVGDVLIEHGNRVDRMNFVDQNTLRTYCALVSRGDPKAENFAFDPPTADGPLPMRLITRDEIAEAMFG